MRRLCVIGLMLTMSGLPVFAEGPLERSILGEASRLARDTAREPDRLAWQAVRLLGPGSTIVITTADTIVTGAFHGMDAATLSVIRDGAVERVNIDDVLVVEKRVRRGSAVAAALAASGGLWLGSGLALGIGLNTRCQPNCGGVELAMFGAVIGMPIAAGYSAWRATSRVTGEVIYRRSAPRP